LQTLPPFTSVRGEKKIISRLRGKIFFIESSIVDIFKPRTIVHTAAYTNVDGAERDWRKAMQINFCGTANIVRICDNNNIDLLFVSTDYVFNGDKNSPYLEDDEPAPLNVYGWSKLAAEYSIQSILTDYYIVRTSFLFGCRYDFIDRLRDAASGSILPFHIGGFASPTRYIDLAQAIVTLIGSRSYGIYHVTNSGFCSRYQFAQKVLRMLKIKTNIIPISEMKSTARRPRYSVLANRHWLNAGFERLKDWHFALREYLVTGH